MSDSQGAPLGEPLSEALRPEIDVKAMPHIIRRIVLLGIKVDPVQVALAIGSSLGAAIAGLIVPRLFGPAIDQVAGLLKALKHAQVVHMPAAQQALLESRSEHSLWVAAGLIVIATSIQGIL